MRSIDSKPTKWECQSVFVDNVCANASHYIGHMIFAHTHTQKLFILSLIAYITTVGAPNWLFLKEEKKVIKEEGLEEKKEIDGNEKNEGIKKREKTTMLEGKNNGEN